MSISRRFFGKLALALPFSFALPTAQAVAKPSTSILYQDIDFGDSLQWLRDEVAKESANAL